MSQKLLTSTFTVEKIPQYKQGDMIVLTKFKPEYGFHDDGHNPKLGTPYKVAKYVSKHAIETHDGNVIDIPVVVLDRDYECGYPNFGGWWIPVEIITHALSMAELTKIIKDKVKSIEGT